MDKPQKSNRGPFSQLQTGCALLMMVNLLVYLALIAFVFNMLDPSKLDPNYLARRGILVGRDIETADERAFQRMVDQKRKEQSDMHKSRKEVFAPSEISSVADATTSDRLPSGWNQQVRPPSPLSDATRSVQGISGRSYRRRSFIQIYPDRIGGRIDFNFESPLSTKTIVPQNDFKTIQVQTAPTPSYSPFRVNDVTEGITRIYTPGSPVAPAPKSGEKMVPDTNLTENLPEEAPSKDAL